MPKKKTGLMYSGNFADYKAGDGYLVMSAGTNPWMATDDYYDTPERVTEAYNLLRTTGLLDKLELIPPIKLIKMTLLDSIRKHTLTSSRPLAGQGVANAANYARSATMALM